MMNDEYNKKAYRDAKRLARYAQRNWGVGPPLGLLAAFLGFAISIVAVLLVCKLL